MTAIITDKIKKQFAQQLLDQFSVANIGDSDNYYYIAAGHSQIWDPVNNLDGYPDPNNTDREERLFRYNMQSVKSVEAASFVIPIADWSPNAIYSAYNDNVEGQPSISYYVRTTDNNVYLCVRTGKTGTGAINISTTKPEHTDTTLPIGADGYVWKFLYTISTADANKFLTSSFMPVKFVDSADILSPDFQQYVVQNAAISGQIVGYRVTEKGGIYNTAPTVTIIGDGSGATARAILNTTGGIEAIEVGATDQSDILTSMGSGYSYGNIIISATPLASGGVPAKAVPIFGPKLGLGADATVDLRSTGIMFNIKPDGTVENTWVVDQGYRQIGLLKNPKTPSGGAFTNTQGLALQRMSLTISAGDGDPENNYGILFTEDTLITGATSTAKGWLDYYDDSATIWYHQDENTGFTPFQNSEAINIEGYTASTPIIDVANIPADVNRYSGELLFINNFNEVTRARGQTEDIKVVVKL
jgi:hypothetical protein